MSSAVRFTVYCDELVRIEHAPGGVFCNWPSLMAIHAPGGRGPTHPARTVKTVSTHARGETVVIETSRVRLEYCPDGHAPSASNTRALIRHAGPPTGVEVEGGRVVWRPGQTIRFNLGGPVETLDGVRGAIACPPGLLARDGWHVLDDSHQHVLVEGWPQTRAAQGLGGNTDWYLFAYGEDYRAALSALARIAGPVPLPRRYALGSWYSRYWPYTSAEYRGIVREYHQHGFPLDVMVLDMDWHREGWTGWSWNRELLPDAEDLLAWLHEQGLAVTLNLHPADGVGPHEDRYADYMRAIGRDPASRETAAFDAGDRHGMEALFTRVLRPLERGTERGNDGVDFWWLDWQQDRFTRSIDGLSNLRWLNHLFFEHTASMPLSGGAARARGLSFSRWAGWGDHRYPVHFSGDAHTGWEMLAFQVPFTVQSGHAGCFYWTHDIGGHFGPRFEEATARWVQFGALSAALRLHSARSATLDRRPWTYETRFTDAMRAAFALRATLMPYVYTAARASFDGHIPLLRSMAIERPLDERSYENPQQFLLGEDLLAAPVVRAGRGEACVATQRVWCPPSDDGDWFDMFTGERLAGGSEAVVAATIDEIPLLARGGAPIPMRPFTLRPAGEALEHLVVRLFPGRAGATVRRELYEDDGVSDAYTRGGFRRTPLVAEWMPGERGADAEVGRVRVTIGAGDGTYVGAVMRRRVTIELAGVTAARVVDDRASGQSAGATIEHDAGRCGGLSTIALGAGDVGVERSVTIEFERADAAAIRDRVRRARLAAAMGPESAGGSMARATIGVFSAAPLWDEARRADALAIGAGIAITPADGRWRCVDTHGLIDTDAAGAARATVEIIERDVVGVDAGRVVLSERVLETMVVDLLRQGESRAADVPAPADVIGTPACGVVRERVARAAFTIERRPVTLVMPMTRQVCHLAAGLVAAPFAWDWRWTIDQARYGPEQEPLDTRAQFALGAGGGGTVSWTPAQAGEKWAVDFQRSHPGRSGLAYVWIRVHADRAAAARLFLNSAGDKVEAWLAHEPSSGGPTAVGPRSRVFVQNGSDSHAAASAYADVRLGAGVNHLLIKTVEGWHQWGVTAWLEAMEPCGLRVLGAGEGVR